MRWICEYPPLFLQNYRDCVGFLAGWRALGWVGLVWRRGLGLQKLLSFWTGSKCQKMHVVLFLLPLAARVCPSLLALAAGSLPPLACQPRKWLTQTFLDKKTIRQLFTNKIFKS